MRVIVTGIILIINFIMQSTLFQYIQIRGIKPNTAIVIVISIAILRGSFEGAIVGFFAGLLQDIFFSNSIGLYSLMGLLLGYFCGKPNRNFFRENYILPFILASAGTFIYDCVLFVFNFLFRGKVYFLYYFYNLIIPEILYNSLIIIIIYKILYSINAKIELREKEKRKLF